MKSKVAPIEGLKILSQTSSLSAPRWITQPVAFCPPLLHVYRADMSGFSETNIMCFLWPASGTRNHRNRTIAGFVSSCLSLRSFSTSAGHTVNLVSPSTACELRCRSGLTTASLNAARCIVLLKASSFSVVFLFSACYILNNTP